MLISNLSKYNAVIVRNKVIVILLFVLCPGLALPLVIWQIYRGHKYAYILLAFFLSMWAFLLAPTGDMYRYVVDYFNYKDLNFQQFQDIIVLKNDYLLGYILFGLGQLHIPADFSRLIYVFIGSLIVFQLFIKLSNNLNDREGLKIKFILFLILFLNYSFTALCFRFNFSCVLYFYSAYYFFFEKKKIIGSILLGICILNHISFILFAVPLLLSFHYKNFGSKRLVLVSLALMMTFSGDFLNMFLKNLSSQNQLIEHALYYTDGVWAGEFVEDHSIGYLLKLYLNQVPFFVGCIIVYKIFKQSRLASLISFMLLLTVFTSPYMILKIRCQTVLLLPLLFYIIIFMQRTKLNKKRVSIYILLISGLIFSFSNLRGKRRELSISRVETLFTQNIFNILSTNYDQFWIETHVNEDGSPANINY